MAEKDDRVPSVAQLADIRSLLVRFQFEAENCGLWPGEPTLPELEGDSYVLGCLEELIIEAAGAFAAIDHPWRFRFRNWDLFWLVELRQIGRSLTTALGRLGRVWIREGGLTGRGTEFYCPGYAIGIPGYTPISDILPPVTPQIAAVLTRCVRRIEELLRLGNDPPTRSRGGRPRGDIASRWKEARALYEVCGSWESAAKAYNQAHGTKFAVSTVQGWGAHLRKQARKRAGGAEPRRDAA